MMERQSNYWLNLTIFGRNIEGITILMLLYDDRQQHG